MEHMGKRKAQERALTKLTGDIDALTIHVAEVFGSLAEMPTIGPEYTSLIGELEQAMQQYVERADALTYRVQQDRERGRW